MKRSDRKESVGILTLKGTLQGVVVSRTDCDKYGKRSAVGGYYTNKTDFMRMIDYLYWKKPTNPNGGDT